MIRLICLFGGIEVRLLFEYFPVAAIVLATLASAIMAFRRDLIAIILILAGGIYGFVAHPADIKDRDGEELAVRGFFIGRAVALRDGERLQRFYVERGAPSGSISLHVPHEFGLGRHYGLRVRIRSKPEHFINPGSFTKAYDADFIRVDPTAQGSLNAWFDSLRQRINLHFISSFRPEDAGLIMALTTGNTSMVSPRVSREFGVTGLSHILSISGTHFGLVAAGTFGALMLVIRALPLKPLRRLTLYISPGQLAATLTLPLILFYLGLSGASVPAVRSFIMITLGLIGLLLARAGQAMRFVLIAGVSLAIWEPDVVKSLSFQLSFLAVASFVLPISEHRGQAPGKGFMPYLSETLKVSLYVMAGIAPLVAYYFHYTSLISPIANIVVTPVLGILAIPLAPLAIVAKSIFGVSVIGTALEALLHLSLWLTHLFASIPFASITVPAFPVIFLMVYYLSFIGYFVSRMRALIAFAVIPLVVYLAISAVAPATLTATFLDVGSADASVIELPDHRTMVIDTGRNGRQIERFLRYRGVHTIDALVISHAHSDHAGGLRHLIDAFRVAEIWDNGLIQYPEGLITGIKHRTLRRGDVYEADGYRTVALHPYPGFHTLNKPEEKGINNDSLVLLVEGRNGSFLLTGDLDDEAARDIASIGDKVAADVMKLPHHGHLRAGHLDLIGRASPSIFIASASRDDQYSRLIEGRVTYRLYEGAVSVSDGLRVKRYADYRIRPGDEWGNIKRLFAEF